MIEAVGMRHSLPVVSDFGQGLKGRQCNVSPDHNHCNEKPQVGLLSGTQSVALSSTESCKPNPTLESANRSSLFLELYNSINDNIRNLSMAHVLNGEANDSLRTSISLNINANGVIPFSASSQGTQTSANFIDAEFLISALAQALPLDSSNTTADNDFIKPSSVEDTNLNQSISSYLTSKMQDEVDVFSPISLAQNILTSILTNAVHIVEKIDRSTFSATTTASRVFDFFSYGFPQAVVDPLFNPVECASLQSSYLSNSACASAEVSTNATITTDDPGASFTTEGTLSGENFSVFMKNTRIDEMNLPCYRIENFQCPDVNKITSLSTEENSINASLAFLILSNPNILFLALVYYMLKELGRLHSSFLSVGSLISDLTERLEKAALELNETGSNLYSKADTKLMDAVSHSLLSCFCAFQPFFFIYVVRCDK